ncbi:MAG TPA: hypothetical protein VF163_07080 [Micromonosporaceae bacterium]
MAGSDSVDAAPVPAWLVGETPSADPHRARLDDAHRCADPHRAVLDAAHAVLRVHVAGEYGFCAGCLDGWARLAPVPCPLARRALSLVETHGVSDWDPVPASATID